MQKQTLGERQLLNKLYECHSSWTMTSAGKRNASGEKREELSHNSLAISGFAQPQPFLELYRPLTALSDGFVDRLLICSIKPQLLLEEELGVFNERLEEFHGFHGKLVND